MKIIFAGTTDFAVPTLEKLKKDYELVLVITQPDRPTGRDKKLTPPPMKVWAQKNNIPVEQPEKIENLEARILNLEPDLLLVAAYGQIIPKAIFDIPKFGAINIHGSILPHYRGASPIQAAILNGDPATGITLIKMDEKMDHGPILGIKTTMIEDNETFPQLYKKLSVLSADSAAETLPQWFAGTLKAQEQNHVDVTFVKMLTRQDAKINWSSPAVEIHRQIRALNPEPGTWTELKGKTIKILEAEIVNDHKIELPGKIYVSDGGKLTVKTLDNGLVIKKIQPEGKTEMSGKDYLNGLKNLSDKIFI